MIVSGMDYVESETSQSEARGQNVFTRFKHKM